MSRKLLKKTKPLHYFFFFSILLNILFLFKNSFLGQKWPNFPFQNKKESQVVRIIDGDTFDIENGLRVRLAGVQAPEYPEGCLAQEAKERLAELISGKTVTLEIRETDSFNRQVAFVFLKKAETTPVFIDKIMLEEGLAQALNDQDSAYGVTLLEAESAAQAAQRGLWSRLCSPPADCLIKGNYRRDRQTRIYHLPECFNYEKIVIDQEAGDRWFCSETEAQAAGFRKAEDCPEN